MGSAAEEGIKYYVVRAENAILKDERYGIGLVRDLNFNLPTKKREGGYRIRGYILRGCQKHGCPRNRNFISEA